MSDDMIERMVCEGFKAMMNTPGIYCDTAASVVRATRACLAAGLRALSKETSANVDSCVRYLSIRAGKIADRLEKPDE